MGAYLSRQIKTNLDMITEIVEFCLIEENNAHGYCTIEGLIADGCQDSLVKESNSTLQVEVYLQDESEGGSMEKNSLFTGLIDEISVFLDGELYKAKIKLVSLSILLDLKKKSRSFQDSGQTYQEILKQIVKEYDNGDVLDTASGGKAIENLIVQYEETDWEFMKRLASHFHASILPAFEFGAPKIYFGLKKGKEAGDLTKLSYTAEKRISGYKQFSANEYPDYKELDAISFGITSGLYYEPGSSLTFQGIPLYIRRMEAKLIQGEILFHYKFSTQNGMGQQKLYPKKLKGVSIKGKVIESVKDKVKVHLEIDAEAPEKKTAWEFPYQTMYTADGEGGWYCMPEPGDTVSVYFPDKNEADAMADSSSGDGDNRDSDTYDPTVKYFRTIHGKEIRFTRDAVIITCSNGVSITMDEDNGISIESSKGISFKSKKTISIEAEETIDLYASERIKLHCKLSRIQMDTMIDIAGPDVRIN